MTPSVDNFLFRNKPYFQPSEWEMGTNQRNPKARRASLRKSRKTKLLERRANTQRLFFQGHSSFKVGRCLFVNHISEITLILTSTINALSLLWLLILMQERLVHHSSSCQ
jgi:hypothetical protein